MTDRRPVFQDLYRLPEDQRIELIAHYVRDHGKTVSVMVDDEPGKPERYTEKLKAAGCAVLERTPGPVAKVVTLRVGPANAN